MLPTARRRAYRTRRLLVRALYAAPAAPPAPAAPARHILERKTTMTETTVSNPATGTPSLDKEGLRVLVAEILDLDVAEVTDDAHFVDDLDVDSLMALEITVRLEREYAVKMAESELVAITSLQGTYDLLDRKLKEKGEAA
ncbi:MULTISPECIES: acyl carrier protein [unclassified Streptomyces]|uniref:acyl carrier protein n=1 Tax=unclassified Streptomyces TaxID=2593676 RepID=UPI0030788FFD